MSWKLSCRSCSHALASLQPLTGFPSFFASLPFPRSSVVILKYGEIISLAFASSFFPSWYRSDVGGKRKDEENEEESGMSSKSWT